MIVPMKKIYILLPTKTLKKDLIELQGLGLVDVTSAGSLDSDNDVVKKHAAVRAALLEVKQPHEEFAFDSSDMQSRDVHEVANRINEITQSFEDTKKDLELLDIQRELATRFCAITDKDERFLAQKGITMTVYKAKSAAKHPVKKNAEYASENGYTHTFCIWKNKEESYWVVLNFQGATIKIPKEWTPIQFPQHSALELEKEISNIKASLEDLKKELHEFNYAYHMLLIAETELSNEIARLSVMNNSYSLDGITVIEGYAPDDVIAKIYSFVTVERLWGIVIDKIAADDDNVPTKIKTSVPVRIIKPLFDFLDVDAGYREFDISFIFLMFMSLFTGMIIGDAGYGLVLFAFSLWVTVSAKMKGKDITAAHMLFLWFSCTTVIWGAITGNWFGYKPFAEIPFLSVFIIPEFSILSADSNVAIQLFAFRIGIIQLILAHAWKCVRLLRTEGLLPALNQIAHITLLLGLFFLVLQLLLGSARYPMPFYTIHLIGIGFILIVLTSEQKRGQNVLIGAGKGAANLITLALNSISAFADIISYIRLYAVGLASFSIAASFNSMGEDVMAGASFGAIIAGIMIVVFGHTLNIIMSVLAVIVHGVRLNVLEFSGHLGMEWTGRKYNPFKRKIITRRI